MMHKIQITMRRLAWPAWSIPLAVAGLGCAVYALLLPWLGFYWDDWAKISVSKLFGLDGYWAYYAGDRPLSAWTHILFTPILGDRPLAWQIFQLALEVLSALGFYWTFSLLWPRAKWQMVSGALLFLVYPVFTARYTAVTFHQQWLQFALYFLSLGLMLRAAQLRSSPWKAAALTALALAASLAQLTVTEYFAPLELLRPLLLWLLLRQSDGWSALGRRRRLWRIARAYSPYLLAIAAYGTWRLFLMPIEGGSDPYALKTLSGLLHQPLDTLRALAPVVAGDTLQSLISAWAAPLAANPLAPPSSPFAEIPGPFPVLAGIFSVLIAAVVFLYLLFLAVDELPKDQVISWRWQALAVGALAFVLGVMPAWITGRQVLSDFHSDRYALPAMAGASLLWITLIDWLTPARMRRALLVAALIGLAANLHLENANAARWLWTTETRFFWQLAWRAPALQPGTALLTYDEIFPNQGLFSLSSALNLLYTPTAGDPPLPAGSSLSYWWYTLTPRYTNSQFKDPIELSFKTQFRSLKFSGGSPNTLLVHYDPANSSCLWVVSPQDQSNQRLPELVRKVSSISNLERIQPQAAPGWAPPEEMFGPEPEHGWCYLFEKADLARQLGDWQTATALGNQALAEDYSPRSTSSNVPHEWMPFIEAFAHSGDWDKAASLTSEFDLSDADTRSALQQVWTRLKSATPDSPAKAQALQKLGF